MLALVFAIIEGCTLNPFLDVAEVGSKSYETVKTAQSVGKVADGVKIIADTRKIKAKTTDAFVKGVGNLIVMQPLPVQAKLITQSITAKIAVEKNTRYKGFIEGFIFGLLGVFLIITLKYVFDRINPKVTEKITKATHD